MAALPSVQSSPSFHHKRINLFQGDSLRFYQTWDMPVTIISDGPYGIKGYPGDLETYQLLPQWYEPHIAAWTKAATPQTTLWFWNTEIGWAVVHPILERFGWEYRACCVWNKGLAHIAGNTNTQVLRKLPVVTEVCVHYVKKARVQAADREMTLQEWLRHEWKRAGLPLSKANEACGVKNAATRKYLTADGLWYYPPVDAFERLAAYANTHGRMEGRPFFSFDGLSPVTGAQWAQMRAKFSCPIGITNVWNIPPLASKERLKRGTKALHLNQKPLSIIENLIMMSSERDDVIWDPFGGLFTGAVAANGLQRRYYGAEINPETYEHGVLRLERECVSRSKQKIEERLPLFENSPV